MGEAGEVKKNQTKAFNEFGRQFREGAARQKVCGCGRVRGSGKVPLFANNKK